MKGNKSLKSITNDLSKFCRQDFIDLYLNITETHFKEGIDTSKEYAVKVVDHYITTQLTKKRDKKVVSHSKRCLALKPGGNRCCQSRYAGGKSEIIIKVKNKKEKKIKVDNRFCYLHNRTPSDKVYNGDGTDEIIPEKFKTPKEIRTNEEEHYNSDDEDAENSENINFKKFGKLNVLYNSTTNEIIGYDTRDCTWKVAGKIVDNVPVNLKDKEIKPKKLKKKGILIKKKDLKEKELVN